MRIAVSLLPDPGRITADVEIAVVIDVLRATSVMAVALAAGAHRIVTCPSVDEAERHARSIEPRPLLCGERHCRPIDGFDLSNSPAEYTASIVANRTLVFTTTNGTRAIAAAAIADHVITASFLNLAASVTALDPHANVHLICAGTDGSITAEDVLLAGAIIDRCESRRDVFLEGDEAMIARDFWRHGAGQAHGAGCSDSAGQGTARSRQTIAQRLRKTQGGRNLLRAGYEADLDRCAAVDTVDVTPVRVSRQPPTFELATREGKAIDLDR